MIDLLPDTVIPEIARHSCCVRGAATFAAMNYRIRNLVHSCASRIDVQQWEDARFQLGEPKPEKPPNTRHIFPERVKVEDSNTVVILRDSTASDTCNECKQSLKRVRCHCGSLDEMVNSSYWLLARPDILMLATSGAGKLDTNELRAWSVYFSTWPQRYSITDLYIGSMETTFCQKNTLFIDALRNLIEMFPNINNVQVHSNIGGLLKLESNQDVIENLEELTAEDIENFNAKWTEFCEWLVHYVDTCRHSDSTAGLQQIIRKCTDFDPSGKFFSFLRKAKQGSRDTRVSANLFWFETLEEQGC